MNIYFYTKFRAYINILMNANNILNKISITENSMNYEKMQDKIEILTDEFIRLSYEIIRIISIKKCECGKFIISSNTGLIQLQSFSKVLDNELENFKNKYATDIVNIKNIRNKYEHEPHNIELVSYVGNNTTTNFTFEYTKESTHVHFNCSIDTLRGIVLSLNKSFNIIIKEILDSINDFKNDNNDAYENFNTYYSCISFKEG